MRRPEEKKKMKSDEISQLYQNIFFKNFEQSFIWTNFVELWNWDVSLWMKIVRKITVMIIWYDRINEWCIMNDLSIAIV